ncbi:MAG: PepSY domain-containing protein [Hyphomicrobiales bacterium]|nr:PepSY domain-containing protein [Hyphomicrobiales bacterium]
MKPDGGCWEVYGTTPDGERVEGYFDPASGEQLLLSQRGVSSFRRSNSSPGLLVIRLRQQAV